MRKKISIVLVLAMVLSMFSGFVYAEHPAQIVGREIKNNTLVQKALDLDYNTKLSLATMLYFLKDEQATIVDGLYNAIEKSDSLKARLNSNGVTKDVVNTILGEIKTEINGIGLTALKNLLEKEDITWGTEITTGITVGSKVQTIHDSILAKPSVINMNNKINEKQISGKTKVGFALELVSELINSGKITKTITNSSTTYSFAITNKSDMLSKVNATVAKYFTGVTPLGSSELEVITHLESKIDGILKDTVKKPDGSSYFNSSEKETVFNAIKFVNSGSAAEVDNKTPNNGVIVIPPVIQPEPPKVEQPKVENGQAKVEIGKDAVEVKTGTKGQSVVAVKSENIKAAVESLVEAIKEAPTAKPVVTVKLEDVKTAAMEVAMPKDSMEKLIENKVDLVIESKALTYVIPANALENELKDTPADSYVEFISSVVEETEVKDLIKDNFVNKIARTIEMQLVVKDSKGEVIKTINKFDNKLKIEIEIEESDGNPDLLGVFYINEATGALEFVGGKVKGNKIIMATDHYSKFAVVEYNKSFSDIENHWSKDYVKSMVAKHVIDGFTDVNLYKPEDQLTRAQFAKLIVETLEIDMVTSKGEFTDVKSGHWAKDYIATAKQLGIVGGYDDGTFKPDQSITRTEMAVMLTNSLGLKKNTNSIALNAFKDKAQIPTWAVEYLVPVVGEKLLVGSDGILNPLGNVTRAEAATIIYRVYNR